MHDDNHVAHVDMLKRKGTFCIHELPFLARREVATFMRLFMDANMRRKRMRERERERRSEKADLSCNMRRNSHGINFKGQKEARYIHSLQQIFSYVSDSKVYEWHNAGGTITYYYPEEKRPDTKDDLLSLGFITPSFDAVLVRIDSQGGDMHNDYLQLEIVSSHLEPDILF